MDAFANPALLPLGPLAVALLWLLERWRQRPVRLVVADVGLFELTPEVEAEARARRRRLGLRFLLVALAALALGLAAAAPRGPRPDDGPVVIDVLLDRGVTSGVVEPDGASRLEHHRRHLRRALAALRDDDRARVHLVPGQPGTTPLAAAAARALLDAATPTAAAADLEAVLARVPLDPRAAADGQGGGGRPGPPVLVATDRDVRAPAALTGRLLVARSGTARPDRALLALARGEDGALHATLASHDAPGPARVRFTARGPDGREVSATREVPLPARGLARASWEGPPADAVAARATLEPGPAAGDALATNDEAFAAAAPPRRRVAVVGEPGAAVRRALRAVPGTELTDVPQSAAALAGAAFDLVLLPALPEVPPRTALVVYTPGLPRAGGLPGGPARGLDHPAFRHTLAELERAPIHVEGLAPLGSGQRQSLLVVDQHPLVAVRGAGRELVVTIAAPLVPEATDWTRHDAFPLFWGELLALAAPRERGALAAQPAGRPWTDPRGRSRVTLQVELVAAEDGTPLLGTVAAPPAALAAPRAAQGLPADLGARLDAARRPGPRLALAPPLAGLALALLLGAWATAPGARPARAAWLRAGHAAS